MPSKLFPQPELSKLILNRQKAGAEALYDQYAKVLSLAIFRIVKNRMITDTLLQHTFLQIWDTFALYNEQKQPLLTWMLAIAKNLASQEIVIDQLEIQEDNDPQLIPA